MSQLNVGTVNATSVNATGNVGGATSTVSGSITVDGQIKASTIRHPSSNTDAISINSSGVVTAINGFATGISELDQWYLNANKTDSSDITNWTRYLAHGTGMSLSGATWTFPSTGKWLVFCSVLFRPLAGDNNYFYTYLSTDNGSSWGNYRSRCYANSHLDNRAQNGANMAFLDITNTSTHKVKFMSGSIQSGSYIVGSSNLQDTNVVFARISDT